MSLMQEYINRIKSGWGSHELENELQQLIAKYNKFKKTYLFVYSAAIGKSIPDVSLYQDDFYIIHDMLTKKDSSRNILDFYIETPGGSGETAEEIVRCLRSKYDIINFVISGEAKSAGTLIALSGDEIWMTETGSLGPIDAQVKIGRYINSAYDYMEWVEQKSKEATKNGFLNPFDATIIAQISPGELNGVYHNLNFAQDLVVDWLMNYKFKHWKETEIHKKPVTDKMKKDQAQKISKELINHRKWRSHGRSLKINDLESMGLRIKKVDDDPILSDIVYRIQTVCRFLFSTTTTYKIFATCDARIFKQATPTNNSVKIPSAMERAEPIIEIEHKCQKCGAKYKFFGKFKANSKVDKDFLAKGYIPFPLDSKFKCKCGFESDLSGIRNQIELQTGKKLI